MAGFTAAGWALLEANGIQAFADAVDGASIHSADPGASGANIIGSVVAETASYSSHDKRITNDGGPVSDTNGGASVDIVYVGVWDGASLLWSGLRRNAGGTAAEPVALATGNYYPFEAGAIRIDFDDNTDADL